ncbi:MAG: cyclase family protein [Acidobacteria bacterium]|nr:cyclase family protein [Acidobacteriota bacterium]
MKTTLMRRASTCLAAAVLCGPAAEALAQSEAREPVSIEQFDRWMEELSNWGRWGDDDQIGAANLMTPAKRREAAALVRTGETVSLSHDFLTEEAADAAEPYVLQMRINPEGQNSGDRVEVYFHGISYSHLDGLCHVFYKDKLYNGRDYRDVVTEDGCSLMDTTQMKDGLVTRGVLVDMARLKGVPYLEPGTKLYREDIEAWEEYAGVRLGPGDALLLRTGRWVRREEVGPTREMAGWDASVIPFLAERDIALLGADSVHEAPNSVPGLRVNPIHRFAIVARGMNLLDNIDLDAAAETAARLGRWEFLLVIAPLRVPGGTGSPVNPIAIF